MCFRFDFVFFFVVFEFFHSTLFYSAFLRQNHEKCPKTNPIKLSTFLWYIRVLINGARSFFFMKIIHFKRIVWRCALLFVLISLEQRDDFRALLISSRKKKKIWSKNWKWQYQWPSVLNNQTVLFHLLCCWFCFFFTDLAFSFLVFEFSHRFANSKTAKTKIWIEK